MNDIAKATEATYKFKRGCNGKTIGTLSAAALFCFIMYIFILYKCAADKPFFMYKSDLLTASLIFLPFIVLLIYLVLHTYKAQSDYIIVSSKGLEIRMRKAMHGYIHDFINWEQIADYALHEVYAGKGNYTPYLVMKLHDETKLRKYSVINFDQRGKAIIECASQFLEPTEFWNRLYTDKDLDLVFEISWMEVLIFIVGIPCGITLALTIDIYDQTFIPYWWWIPVVALTLAASSFIQPKEAVRRPAHYFIFLFLSAAVCGLFLWSNYHFASWDTPCVKKRYEIHRVYPYRNRGGKIIKFTAIIKYNDSAKDIPFPLDQINELNNSKGIEFELHKGLFGFDVYKEIRLY